MRRSILCKTFVVGIGIMISFPSNAQTRKEQIKNVAEILKSDDINTILYIKAELANCSAIYTVMAERARRVGRKEDADNFLESAKRPGRYSQEISRRKSITPDFRPVFKINYNYWRAYRKGSYWGEESEILSVAENRCHIFSEGAYRYLNPRLYEQKP